MIHAIQEGFRAVRRSWGLVALLLAVNGFVAALLAAPLAATLRRDLDKTQAASNMMYGFDHVWWSHWWEGQSGWTQSFSPDIFGVGFAFKNVDLLLKGQLPARLLARPADRREEEPEEPGEPGISSVILGLGLLYLVVQTFLTGGLLGVFRSQQGSWTLRSFLHGSGFYFGRLARVAVLALLADYLLFRLNAPFARWADRRALEAASEQTANAWSLGRHALLLLGLLLVNMLSCYAKVIVVLEERSSAVLAFLSSLSFCMANLARALGHYLSLVLLAVLLLAVWGFLDGHWTTIGYKTQIVTLLLMQGFVAGRIALRLALLAGQTALYRKLSAP